MLGWTYQSEAKVIKLITAADLPHIPALINNSSQGYSFAFHLDLMSYLGLSSYWDLSYQHSYIAYSKDRPAGVLLSTVSPGTQDCYSFYWGVLPEFRGGPLALRMVIAFLSQVASEGFVNSHADICPDSPRSLYYRLGYREVADVLYLEAGDQTACHRDNLQNEAMETLTVNQFVAEIHKFKDSFSCWGEQPVALRKAARSLKFVKYRGVYAGFIQQAEAIRIMSFHFEPSNRDSAAELILQLRTRPFGPSLHFCHVRPATPLHSLLVDLKFTATKRSTALHLDLRAWAESRRSSKSHTHPAHSSLKLTAC